MTRKRRRLNFVLVGMLLLGSAAGLVLYASDTLVFFYNPSDLQTKQASAAWSRSATSRATALVPRYRQNRQNDADCRFR